MRRNEKGMEKEPKRCQRGKCRMGGRKEKGKEKERMRQKQKGKEG